MIFGIIGYGRFGKLWANALIPFGKVKVYDPIMPTLAMSTLAPPLIRSRLEEVTQCDILFLLVPISAFKACCQTIQPFLKPHTVIVDACSVKIYPTKVMKHCFSKDQPLLATHPLFGPDSVQASGGLKGHKIVVCSIQQDNHHLTLIETLFIQLGLHIVHSTPEEHDQQMAHSQALVHFIGRGLSKLELKPQEMTTPDFQALLNMNQKVVGDTWQLFLDMHRYNPYTPTIRSQFIHQLNQLQQEIHMITIDQPNMIEEQQKNPSVEMNLETMRTQINAIDAAIIEKLAQRQAISKQVGALKAKTGKQVLDAKREEELMRYYETLSQQHGLDPEFVKTLFRMVHAHSRQLQK